MTRIGLSIDELVARSWSGQASSRYAARVDGIDVLEGETLALVGPGAGAARERISAALDGLVPIDGAHAARAGTLRIHALQASRIGLKALSVSDPLSTVHSKAARSLALADLAGLAALGLTTVVDLCDAACASLVADRIGLVAADGRVERALPVLAPRPRRPRDVVAVAERAHAHLAAV